MPLAIDELGGKSREELRKALLEIRKAAPTVFCGVNICQYRGFERMYTRQENGLIPHVALITPANGVGKTQMMMQDIVGWTKGSAYLNRAAFPKVALDFYDSLQQLRDSGGMSLRLCCDAEDTKEGGSVFLAVREWIPDAKFTAMDSSKCYRQLDIPHPTIERMHISIAIKTFNQEVRKLSGSNCHKIFINEPMPHELWGETVARTRSKKGAIPGTIAMFATVLNQAPYVSELIDNPRNIHITGHCWENCVGEEVTDAMAAEVLEETGTRLEKNPKGLGYITNGVLTKQSIEDIFANMECSPEELKARKCGKLIHLEGRIFKELNVSVHQVKRNVYEDAPKEWPIVQVVDPHDRHPDFSAWFLVTPSNKVVALAEHPRFDGRQYFESIRNRTLDIADTCEAWRRIESEMGFTGRVIKRLGDPNKFLNPNPRNNKQLLWDYAEEGFNFDIDVLDDITVGHNKMHSYFKYNHALWEQRPDDPLCLPRAMVVEDCHNIWRSLTRYAWKEKKDPTASPSEMLDQKFKGPVDVMRYMIVWVSSKDFKELRQDPSRMTTMDKFKLGRVPRSERDIILGKNDINLKGRRLVGIASMLSSNKRFARSR